MPKRKHPKIFEAWNGRLILNGEFVFYMYDTYGLPFELLASETHRLLLKHKITVSDILRSGQCLLNGYSVKGQS